jgi:hypothetical protein
LNTAAQYTGKPQDADETARNLLKQIIEVLINLDAENLGVISDRQDFEELRASFAYKEFCVATTHLQKVLTAFTYKIGTTK